MATVNASIQNLLKEKLRHTPEADPSSLSNYQAFQLLNTAVNLRIDFSRNVCVGSVTFDINSKQSTDEIILDTSFLAIFQVKINGKPVQFNVGDRVEPLGSPLTIKVPSEELGGPLKLEIRYETTDECTALQWFKAEQTVGKKHPYMFSQCQAIHARSLYPCFDTPSVKSPFDICLISEYPCVSSGNPVDSSEKNEYKFKQEVPIASYLFALASGDLSSAAIGPRSQVYTEPVDLPACKHEFEADVEPFIQTAEKLAFPYEWKTYNVLVLPPSFPYGGMENPNITFATPTLISGDRENVDVIAHELAHSWSGNLVTNCSWEHFWLNEGWTVYLERRIIGAIHGEKSRHFSAIIGWTELKKSIDNMGADNEYTKLVVDLQGKKDPDDAFSVVPYEKGSNLLFLIETKLGREVFDPFIPYYFSKFKKQSLDTYQFLDALFGYFKDNAGAIEKLNSIEWNKWLFQPGMPPVKPDFDTSLADECYNLADRWLKVAEAVEPTAPLEDQMDFYKLRFSVEELANFSANQIVVFLETLIEGKEGFSWKDHKPALLAMAHIYPGLAVSKNAEVLSRWFRLNVVGEIESVYEQLAEWLGTVGRMKFVRPGYRSLMSVDLDLAKKTFEKSKNFYHPICRMLVEKDLSSKKTSGG